MCKFGRKSKCNDSIESLKCTSMLGFIDIFNLIDAYRSKKNSNNEGCGRTFNPRRVTNESSRLDYILMSEKMVDSAQKLEMSVLPKSLIESDHNLLSLKIIIGKMKQSRNNRK